MTKAYHGKKLILFGRSVGILSAALIREEALRPLNLRVKTILHSVVWNGNSSNRGLYYKQSLLTDNSPSPIQIGLDTSLSGDIAALDNKHLSIIYTMSDLEEKRVISKTSSDSGKTWSAAHQLTKDGAKPSHPRVVATPEGFKFFWTEWQENGDAITIMSEFN